jgi:4-amino-4-deoxy-L-arabinose transferase-like glycosyltransferase
VNPRSTARAEGRAPALILAGLIVLAGALRFWHLGDWSFNSDETFTLRDSLAPSLSNPRPLLYYLNYHLVRPFTPLDELGLRLLPALFGVLAIPTFYLMNRRLVGTRAALFGSLLLTVSGLHVFYSQFARYWSLVFLLAAVYPYAVYLGLRERKYGLLALGIVTGALAVVAHPSTVLLLGGLGVWLLATYATSDRLRRLRSNAKLRWGAVLTAVLVGAVLLRAVRLLHGWIVAHDSGKAPTEFLLHLPGGQGVKQIALLMAYVESLTIPLVLIGALGIYLLLQQRDRSLGLLLACTFLFHVSVIVLLSFRTPAGLFYLVPVMPIVFTGAGVFLDRLAAIDWELRPRWVLPATVAVMVMAAGAPTLISQYRDGRRYDFRSAAAWLDTRLANGDVVYSDEFKVLLHYMPGSDVRRLRGDPADLVLSVQALHRTGQGKALWIVTPAPSHAFRTNPKLGSLRDWIYDNCRLRNTIGVGRVDFRQYHLQIFRCPMAVAREAVANSE